MTRAKCAERADISSRGQTSAQQLATGKQRDNDEADRR